MNPSFLNLPTKAVHTCACGADHFRDDLLRDVGQRASAGAPLIAVSQDEQYVGQTLFARIEELIGQIGFEANLAREDVRDQSVRDCSLRAEQPTHVRLRDDERLRSGHGDRGVPPDDLAPSTSSLRNGPAVKRPQIASLPPGVVTASQTRPFSMCITLSHALPWMKKSRSPWILGDCGRRSRRLEQVAHIQRAVVLELHELNPCRRLRQVAYLLGLRGGGAALDAVSIRRELTRRLREVTRAAGEPYPAREPDRSRP
jgi:hypothetical protein